MKPYEPSPGYSRLLRLRLAFEDGFVALQRLMDQLALLVDDPTKGSCTDSITGARIMQNWSCGAHSSIMTFGHVQVRFQGSAFYGAGFRV